MYVNPHYSLILTPTQPTNDLWRTTPFIFRETTRASVRIRRKKMNVPATILSSFVFLFNLCESKNSSKPILIGRVRLRWAFPTNRLSIFKLFLWLASGFWVKPWNALPEDVLHEEEIVMMRGFTTKFRRSITLSPFRRSIVSSVRNKRLPIQQQILLLLFTTSTLLLSIKRVGVPFWSFGVIGHIWKKKVSSDLRHHHEEIEKGHR